jgi:hypothetical protein
MLAVNESEVLVLDELDTFRHARGGDRWLAVAVEYPADEHALASWDEGVVVVVTGAGLPEDQRSRDRAYHAEVFVRLSSKFVERSADVEVVTDVRLSSADAGPSAARGTAPTRPAPSCHGDQQADAARRNRLCQHLQQRRRE